MVDDRNRKRILEEGWTEPPGSGELLHEKRAGIFKCARCGQPLFTSEEKYDSRSGWPSFTAPVEGAVEEKQDLSHGMVRTEALCSKCRGHLGHVFDDGPRGKPRYCINSGAMRFSPEPSARAHT